MSEAIAISLLAALFGTISTILGLLQDRRDKRRTEKKTSEKIDKISDLLKSASSEIRKMERDLEKKRKIVKKLESQKKEFDTLISLRAEQVDALKKEISSILEKNRRRSIMWTIVIGAMWFIIGLIMRGMLGF